MIDKARNAHRVYFEPAGVTYIKRSVKIPVRNQYTCVAMDLLCTEKAGLSSSSGKSAKSKSSIFPVFDFSSSYYVCRCGLGLFYRHSNTDEGVHFIFPGNLVRSGEKPVTTLRAEPIPEPPKKRSKV